MTKIILFIFLQTMTLYSMGSGGWHNVASMNEERGVGHAAVLLDSNRVLVTGGEGFHGILNAAEIYHINENFWSTATPMLFPRTGHKLIKIDENRVMAISGIHTLSCEIYNIAENKWTLADSINNRRYAQWTATLLKDSRILITGGLNIFGENDETKYPRSCEIYIPSSDKWIFVDSLDIGRYGHSAVLLNNGEVLITGGFNVERINQALLFKPEDNTFTKIDTPALYRHNHNSLLLNNEKVLISGGTNLRTLNDLISSVDEFSSGSNIFEPRFNIYMPLENHSVFELLNSQLLAVGDGLVWQLIEYSTGNVLSEGLLDTMVVESALIKIANDRVISIGGGEVILGYPSTITHTKKVMIFDQNYTSIKDVITNGKLGIDVDIFPNPFNGTSLLRYELKESAEVKMVIFDITGRQIQQPIVLTGQIGFHRIPLNFSNNGSGIFFIQININGKSTVKKVINLK